MNKVASIILFAPLKIRESLVNGAFRIFYTKGTCSIFSQKPSWMKTKMLLAKLPAQSLGKSFYHFLVQHDLRLIPGYEHPLLLHFLLGYPVNGLGAIQVKHCLIRVHRKSLCQRMVVGISWLLFPEYWSTFRQISKQGQNLKPISNWRWEYLWREPLDFMKAFICLKYFRSFPICRNNSAPMEPLRSRMKIF